MNHRLTRKLKNTKAVFWIPTFVGMGYGEGRMSAFCIPTFAGMGTRTDHSGVNRNPAALPAPANKTGFYKIRSSGCNLEIMATIDG